MPQKTPTLVGNCKKSLIAGYSHAGLIFVSTFRELANTKLLNIMSLRFNFEIQIHIQRCVGIHSKHK